MIRLKIVILTLVFVAKLINSQFLPKCSYGERGSLTATCQNAGPTFFRQTSYHFDMLDETLRCVSCNLETLEANTFDIGGNQIINLDLRNSRIVNIRESAFTGLVFLKHLYLQNNRIAAVNSGTFRGIKKLLTLDMSNNSIANLASNAFAELQNLTTLYLNNNRLKTLTKNCLLGLNALATLNLANNELTSISNLGEVRELKLLDLSFNNISEIHSGDFESLQKLEILNLAYNKLFHFETNALKSMHKLLQLNLTHNNISEISLNTFEGLESVEILDLESNSIKTLNKGAFYGLTDLRELRLAHNELSAFVTRNFFGLPHMVYLNLSHNKIKDAMAIGNSALHSLHTLDLSYNNLTDLDYVILHKHIPRLVYLGLEGNKWPCYLIKEMDDHFVDDNVKLSVESVLQNASCPAESPEEKKSAQTKRLEFEESINEKEVDSSKFASAHAVYTLISLSLILNLGLAFLLYKLFVIVKSTRMNATNGMTVSRSNLISAEFGELE